MDAPVQNGKLFWDKPLVNGDEKSRFVVIDEYMGLPAQPSGFVALKPLIKVGKADALLSRRSLIKTSPKHMLLKNKYLLFSCYNLTVRRFAFPKRESLSFST